MFKTTSITKMIAAMIMAAAFTTTASATNGINITPAEGEVTELDLFELHFDSEWSLGSNRSGKIKMTGPEGVTIPKIMNYSTGTYYVVYFEDDAVINTPGDYTLTIPAAKFAIGDVDLPETSFHYTIVSSTPPQGDFPTFTTDPAEGPCSELSAITLTFDTNKTITLGSTGVSLHGPNGGLWIKTSADNDTHSVTVTTVDAYENQITVSDPGTYTLTFAKGAIKIDGSGNEEAITLTYTIDSGSQGWGGELAADPAADSHLTSIKEIFITFEGATRVTISDTAGPNDFPKLFREDNTVASTAMSFAQENILDVSLSTEITAPGNYYLKIPATFIKIDGNAPSSDIVINYTIDGSIATFDYTWSFNPAEGSIIGPEDAIDIDFMGETLTSVENDIYAWGKDAPHFSNEMSAYNPEIQVVEMTDTGFRLVHQWPFEQTGEYTLVIPANYFTLTDNDGVQIKNTPIEATFSVEVVGIELNGPDDENATFDVYNAQGIEVMHGVKANDLNKLPAGLYIAKGRKILVK